MLKGVRNAITIKNNKKADDAELLSRLNFLGQSPKQIRDRFPIECLLSIVVAV
jgi:hypothetical protein